MPQALLGEVHTLMDERWQKDLALAIERFKASLRAKVEHPFDVIKNLFGYKKTCYRGLCKNDALLHTLFALSNVYQAK